MFVDRERLWSVNQPLTQFSSKRNLDRVNIISNYYTPPAQRDRIMKTDPRVVGSLTVSGLIGKIRHQIYNSKKP